MELGMVGLGKMGANMTRRLLKGGHHVVVFDPRPEPVKELQAEGATGAASLPELVDLPLARIAEIWCRGSGVRSWLLDLTARALGEDEELKDIRAWVADSGEGRRTVFEAVDLNVPAPAITFSLQHRLRSREPEPVAEKLLAALRQQFGGRAAKRQGE